MCSAKRLFLVVTLPFIFIVLFCSSSALGSDPKAADLVRAARESENWIHKIDSLYIRIESQWLRAPEAIAAKQAELKELSPSLNLELKQFAELAPNSKGILEYAIDQGRVRFLNEEFDHWRIIKIWDGKKFIAYEKYFLGNQEQYHLSWTAQGNFNDLIAFQTSWPRSQPHSFWWDIKDVDELMSYYGRPEEFAVIGRSNYRGVDCYILEFYPRELWAIVAGQAYRCDCGSEDRLQYGRIGEMRGLADQSYRWYVGIKDRRLYGLEWLIMNKPHVEHWMLDYKEVSPGCFLPMTQGYELYGQDGDGKPLLEARRNLKILEVRINQKLPDTLFQIKLNKGVKVIDNRSGRSITYIYEPDPPELVGKTLPDLGDIKVEFPYEQARTKMILVCFFDMLQRPSRNCLLQLSTRAQELKAKDVMVIAIQPSKVDKSVMEEWLKGKNISFAVGMIQGGIEKICFTWGVRAFPWLILTDKNHIVTAEGFAVNELDEKITQTSIRKGQ